MGERRGRVDSRVAATQHPRRGGPLGGERICGSQIGNKVVPPALPFPPFIFFLFGLTGEECLTRKAKDVYGLVYDERIARNFVALTSISSKN